MKNSLFSLTRSSLFLCLFAGLIMSITSCGSDGPSSPDHTKDNILAISSINPTKGPVGSVVTIKGSHFSADKNNNVVKFGQTQATVNKVLTSRLVVTVPENLNPGDTYEITVTAHDKTAAAPYKFKVSIPQDTAEARTADGILETVTWNIEWFGYTNFGPTNEALQTNNIVRVADTLNADLYALEEIQNKEALQKLAGRMKGYHAVFGDTKNQGNGFIYNTNVIDSVSSGIIRKGQFLHEWAGRKPFYFSFRYHPGNGVPSILIYAVVIHAKAGAGQDDYQRRVAAAEKLYNYLTTKKPDAEIVLLGDFNDELNTSIYKGHPSPYKNFVQNKTNYDAVTLVLSKDNKTSEVNYQSVIDNIIISNEMVKYYKTGSAHTFRPGNTFIPNYENTTSDHYPVIALFDMRQQ